MELLSDERVRSRLGFLHEVREVDGPNAFPEPVAEVSEELSLPDDVASSSLSAANMPRQRACAPRLNARLLHARPLRRAAGT
jgi:hypothetical protein